MCDSFGVRGMVHICYFGDWLGGCFVKAAFFDGLGVFMEGSVGLLGHTSEAIQAFILQVVPRILVN